MSVVDLSQLNPRQREAAKYIDGPLLVLAGAACVGAVMSQRIPDVIQARAFQVIDETGTRNAGMNAHGIYYRGETGTGRALMSADGIGWYESYTSGRNETLRVAIDADGIAYHDTDGNPRSVMPEQVQDVIEAREGIDSIASLNSCDIHVGIGFIGAFA